jgi:hypothetical protein
LAFVSIGGIVNHDGYGVWPVVGAVFGERGRIGALGEGVGSPSGECRMNTPELSL